MIEKCNLCGGQVLLKNPREIYGNKYKHILDKGPGIPISFIYECQSCKATVGCHNETDNPLGTLANKETKMARNLCHKLLDPLWKKGDGDYKTGTQGSKRKELYKMLSDKMGIELEKTHFGMFDITQCRKAYKIILEYKNPK